MERKEGKLSINANPAGTLEIAEFFNRMASRSKEPAKGRSKEGTKRHG